MKRTACRTHQAHRGTLFYNPLSRTTLILREDGTPANWNHPPRSQFVSFHHLSTALHWNCVWSTLTLGGHFMPLQTTVLLCLGVPEWNMSPCLPSKDFPWALLLRTIFSLELSLGSTFSYFKPLPGASSSGKHEPVHASFQQSPDPASPKSWHHSAALCCLELSVWLCKSHLFSSSDSKLDGA